MRESHRKSHSLSSASASHLGHRGAFRTIVFGNWQFSATWITIFFLNSVCFNLKTFLLENHIKMILKSSIAIDRFQ